MKTYAEVDLERATYAVELYHRQNPGAHPVAFDLVRAKEINPETGKTKKTLAVGSASRKLRDAHETGQLSETLIQRLDVLDSWVWSNVSALTAEAEWVLRQETGLSGDVNLPVCRDGYQWASKTISALRDLHRNGALPAETVALFEGLPGWTWDELAAEVRGVAKTYQEIAADVELISSLLVRSDLAGMIETVIQRRDELTTDQVHSLESLPGWAWDERLCFLRALEIDAAKMDSYERAYQTWLAAETDEDAPEHFGDNAAGRLLEEHGGYEGVALLIAEREWELGTGDMPQISQADSDLLAEVVEFVTKHGHSDFPLEFPSVRDFRNEPAVHPTVKATLNDLDGWHWNHADATVFSIAGRIAAYFERTDSKVVPLGHRDTDGFNLGRRVAHLPESRSKMTSKGRKLLDELLGTVYRGVDHYREVATAAAWVNYFNEHGHAGLLHSDNVDLETQEQVNRWLNASSAWRKEPLWIDTSELPDYPVESMGRAGRANMKSMAFWRVLQMFTDREGAGARFDENHVEAGFPLGQTTLHAIQWLNVGYPSEERTALLEQLSSVFLETGDPVAERKYIRCRGAQFNSTARADEIGHLCYCDARQRTSSLLDDI